MTIRPESESNNSSRSNTAYGISSGYYFPNLNSKYDLRGDCARIVLYTYVRWGETNKLLNAIESVDVLLKWNQADPVDTWELARNDSVQSITGTRNVFVDYPELAFILFGREVPAGLVTPSAA
jgi:endonuclease I